MESKAKTATILPFQRRQTGGELDLHDLRFRALIGARDWDRLSADIRNRFSKRLSFGRTVSYAGEIIECRMNLAGRLLAQLLRLVGAPLPTSTDIWVPAVVSVSEDEATGGQFWTRIYGRHHGFPQVIHSSKRFSGPTGLEEYLGCGLGIALTIDVEREALHFRSDHYFLAVRGLRLRLPKWLAPGDLTISHVDCTFGSFAFILLLHHPLFGELVSQTAVFRELQLDKET